MLPWSHCAGEVETHLARVLPLSGAPIAVTWDATDAWAAGIFERAERHLQGCWDLEGRYWEVKLRIAEYLASVTAAAPAGEGCWEAALPLLSGAEFVHIGLCAPLRCGRQGVASTVLTRYLGESVGPGCALPTPRTEDVFVAELSRWSRVPLDFAIAGVDSCGTTSLHRNLALHEGIDFTTVGEDSFFFRHDRALPRLAEIEELEDLWAARQHRRLRGICHPGLFHSARARQALKQIPGLRVVAIVCDPLQRLEKNLLTYHLCSSPSLSNGSSGSRLGGHDGSGCWASVSEAVEGDPSLPQHWRVGEHLHTLQGLLGSRLRVLHQEAIRLTPAAAYQGLATFLGATGTFPSAAVFRRYNSLGGGQHRTDLCGNSSLLALLRARLRGEYKSLEALLRLAGSEAGVPEVLRLRWNRCDRLQSPEEWEVPARGTVAEGVV